MGSQTDGDAPAGPEAAWKEATDGSPARLGGRGGLAVAALGLGWGWGVEEKESLGAPRDPLDG